MSNTTQSLPEGPSLHAVGESCSPMMATPALLRAGALTVSPLCASHRAMRSRFRCRCHRQAVAATQLILGQAFTLYLLAARLCPCQSYGKPERRARRHDRGSAASSHLPLHSHACVPSCRTAVSPRRYLERAKSRAFLVPAARCHLSCQKPAVAPRRP